MPRRGGGVVVAAAALILVAAAAFGRHVAHGGFSADDWAFTETIRHPGPAGVFTDVWNVVQGRPAFAVYLGLILAHVGANSAAWLAIGTAVHCAAALLFFAALRAFGVSRTHAWLLAALALVFPLSDATTLWFAASLGGLAAAFYLAGLTVTVRALRRGSPLWGPAHLAGAALYALSIMSYEITAPVIACSGFLYLFVARRSAAARRAVVDVIVAALVVGLISYPLTPKTVHGGIGTWITHLKLIVLQGSQMLGWGLFPFKYLGQNPEIAALLAGAAALTAVGLWTSRTRPALRAELRCALLIAATGLAITLAGWLVLVPGDLGYSPGAVGNGNRINVAAGFGVLLVVYGVLRAGAAIVTALLPRRNTARAGPLVAIGVVAVGAGYLYRLEHDIDLRDQAAVEQTALLDALHARFPTIPPGDTVYVTGYQAQTYTDIPVFDLPFDLVNAVRYEWHDAGISAWPVVGTTSIACGADAVGLMSAGIAVPGEGAPYGRAYLFSYAPRRTLRIASASACSAAARAAG